MGEFKQLYIRTMISHEDIYDLDTPSLEQKIQQLEESLPLCSPRQRRKRERTLELAKLQCEERQVLEYIQFFENNLSKCDFLYLHEQPLLPLEPSTKPSIKAKTNVKREPCNRIFTIPKPIESLRYKPPKQKAAVAPLKKTPSVTVHHRLSIKIEDKPIERKRTHSIAARLSKVMLEKKAENKETVSKEGTVVGQERKAPQKKQLGNPKYKVENKVKFIENEYSLSSDEEVNENELFKPELIKMQESRRLEPQSFISAQTDKQTGISQGQIQQQISVPRVETQESSIQQQIPPSVPQVTNQVSNQEQKQSFPVYKDIIDYFRFTRPKRKEESKQDQVSIQQSIPQEIRVVAQQSKFQEIQLAQQYHVKFSVPDIVALAPEQPVCQSERLIHSQVAITPVVPRPTTQHAHSRKLRPVFKQTPKIIKQLPIPTISYSDIIPTFNHLFHSQADMSTVMREFIGVIGQHLTLQTKQPAKEVEVNLQKEYLVQKYGHLVDINLAGSRSRQAPEQPEQQASCLYYRVVKTKQEVYDIITNTFARTNWVQLPHGLNLKQSWNLLWTWSKPQIDFKGLIYFQKVNHFINNKHISRKDLLKKNIEKIKRLGTKIGSVFDIIPDTYLLPGETESFIKKFNQYSTEKMNIWIMKPIGLSRGRGIRLVTELTEVYYDQPVVLQKYLKQPLLLDGIKFDMRIYVVVTSMNPLQAFIYREGFARLSTEKYSLEELDNNFVHLTNFSIQRQNLKSEKQSVGGSKISLKMLRKKLEGKGINWDLIWSQIVEVVLKSLIACMNEISSIPNCFQLFGYDIIIDSKLKCWLLEVNSSPSLEKEFALDELIKQQLTDDIIKLVDPPSFNRIRLKQVLERRVMETEGRKSYINTNNNTAQQLNQDLCYILNGLPLTKYGERNNVDNFIKLAPSETYFRLIKVLQNYKKTSVIKKL